jgi:hypothetical protein
MAMTMSSRKAPAAKRRNRQEEEPDEELDSFASENPELNSLLNSREMQQFMADDDLEGLNDENVTHLPDAPLIGGRSTTSDMWGTSAEQMGRAMSPKLYSSAASHPTATQFKVWRWESGVPTLLGAIDIEASEDDFIKRFLPAMPEKGDGRFQFRMRPVDISGKELGKEITINISEHHATLHYLRRKEQNRKDEENAPMHHGYPSGQPIVINQPPAPVMSDSSSGMEEMGRMFEKAVDSAEQRAEALQRALEDERERLRIEEGRRAEERVKMAVSSSEIVQRMTERLMQVDQSRAAEQLNAQKDQANLLMTTLTTVFQQQQEASRAQAERLRESDMQRMNMDREFFQQQRSMQEERRHQEKQEAEARMMMERDRLQQEQKRMESQRAFELEQMRIEAQRRDAELERKRSSEKEEQQLRLERERMEMERARQQMIEERERWRVEVEERRRQETMEWERKRSQEREEAERRRQIEKEEADRKERESRERFERERMMWQQQVEMQKAELDKSRMAEERRAREEREAWERRLLVEKQEADRKEQLRREELQLQMKQMEMQAQRDREHQEKMMEMARLEREAQREAQLAREKVEAEQRALAEAERTRQHQLTMREMELTKERDREHAERMIQLSKAQQSGGFGQMGELLGMETPELLSRIFGGGGAGGESNSSWSDAIPKVLGGIADVAKAAVSVKAPPQPAQPAPRERPAPQKRRPELESQPMVQIQTPEGPRIIPLALAQQLGYKPEPEKEPVAAQAESPAARQAQQAPNPQKPAASVPRPAPVKEESIDEETEGNDDQASPFLAALGPIGFDDDYPSYGATDTSTLARMAGIKLVEQKSARKGLKALCDKLRSSDTGEWSGHITAALMQNARMWDYINAVSLKACLYEAGAEEDLANKIVAELRNSPLVPDDLPYTKRELIAKKEKEGEK